MQIADIPTTSDDVGGRGASGRRAAADRRALALILLALVGVRLLLVDWLPFTDTTEARYAEMARKMVETGDWITPQFDYGVPFWGKPPLHTWLAAAGMEALGVGPWGARLPILATALATLGVLWSWARITRGPDVALAAVAVAASAGLFFGASAFVMTDMVMTLGVTLSLVGLHRCASSPGGGRLWGHLAFAGLAIGMLAKGPVAIVLVAAPALAWIALGRRWRAARRLPWATGLLLAAALTVPWYVAAELKTPGFLKYFLVGEHFERFVVPGWKGDLYGSGHEQAMGAIWLFAALAFLPWTPFLLAALARPRRIRRAAAADTDGLRSLLALWLLAPLVFFTPAANILIAYALPAIPAAAFLTVLLWRDAFGASGGLSRLLAGAAFGLALAVYLTGAVLVRIAPDALGLRAEDRLVAALAVAAPDAQLHYFRRRSYSGEFYTAGQATTLPDRGALADLIVNGRQDAVALSSRAAKAMSPELAMKFTDLGAFGRHRLLLERDVEARP